MAEDREKIQEEIMTNYIKMCVYRVPYWLKAHVCDGNDPTSYEPEIVSLGPYHRGNSKVKEMEKHKRRCLDTMLKRNQQNLDEYLTEMRKIEMEVRACYQEPYEKIYTEDFVEMLVLDGCFMLEFLRVSKLGLQNLNYKYDDPVFSKDTIILVIARDMIKLENQIPLIVLEKLLSLQYKQPIKNKKHIPKLVLQALTPLWITNHILTEKQLKTMRSAVASDPDNMMLHCLDIFRSGLLYKIPEDIVIETRESGERGKLERIHSDIFAVSYPTSFTSSPTNKRPDRSSLGISSRSYAQEKQKKVMQPVSCLSGLLIFRLMNYGLRPKLSNEQIKANSMTMMYCVEELREAGIKFKTRKSQAFWDIKFDKNQGLLEIPPIKIDDATKTVLLNLIAYEQCHLRQYWEMYITDYVGFMFSLLNSASDVNHLKKAGIIVNQIGSDAEAVDLFNRLLKKVVVNWRDGKLSNLYEELSMFCNHKRHRWLASWRNEYLNNPWVIISIIAAILLLLLTLLQTAFTIYWYSKAPKSI